MEKLQIAEIHWEGPISVEDINDLNKSYDHGIYQIYGTHSIFGPNALLYIGKAQDRYFSQRLNEHKKYWLLDEASDIQIYIGRLGGIEDIENDEWSKLIDVSERMLIYYCSPPYNSSNIYNFNPSNEDAIVLNYGQRNMLPFEVSTFWKKSNIHTKKDWGYYTFLSKDMASRSENPYNKPNENKD